MMPQPILRAYAGRLPELVGEYQSLMANAAAYPYMDAAGQRNLRRGWQQAVKPRRKQPLAPQQYAARLVGLGFGFVLENAASKSAQEVS